MPPELFGMAGMCVQNIIDVTFFSLSSELSVNCMVYSEAYR